jgi:23S rRNA (guanosine2251-2'-O)-methyltransferase
LARHRADSGRGADLLYGLHPVAEALRAKRREFRRLILRKGREGGAVRRICARAEALGVPVQFEPDEVFRKRLPEGSNDQGVALEAGPLPELDIEQLMARGQSPQRFVALDGVEDPQNVGAIARVAEASGAAGLILTSRRAPPLGSAVARASAGAIESLPVARVPNLAQALERLQKAGFWTFGADLEASTDLFELPDRAFEGDACIVLGAEGRGLRPGVRRRLDHPIRIPMPGRVGSLNVASAAAVVLFEWVRRTPRPEVAGSESGAPGGSRSGRG